ncbi:hypothetical protein ABF162_13740 [Vibrio coralliilyticus]|uniref:hypothetical protein n=1 Tax=Vibrio coralliilyticus TaxID=190893 RepID=UPI00118709D1|nr:hypothetical protein [Vibrio coralliilyticus]
MASKHIENIVREFEKLGETSLSQTLKYKDKVYTVRISKRDETLSESFSFATNMHKSNTVSALPSGSPCGCCNGTGRA